jgi:hypothetical protein
MMLSKERRGWQRNDCVERQRGQCARPAELVGRGCSMRLFTGDQWRREAARATVRQQSRWSSAMLSRFKEEYASGVEQQRYYVWLIRARTVTNNEAKR